jgi:hypothetical protein
MNRLILIIAAALCVALEACCSARWELTERGQAAIAAARPTPIDLDFDGCDLTSSETVLARRAARILADEERALVDFQDRLVKALTEQERGALTERRDQTLDAMIGQVKQLRAILAAPAQIGVASLAIIYTSVNPAAPLNRTPSLDVEFDYVTTIGANESPVGVVARGVTSRQALAALIDDMETYARDNDLLTQETRDALKD